LGGILFLFAVLFYLPFFDKLYKLLGPLAQLVARLDGIEEVAGSSPARSTLLKPPLRAVLKF
jgi:hypothetical protein